MHIFSHGGLADAQKVRATDALLLEGSWPASAAPGHVALDDQFDSRYRWLDAAASDLAVEAAGPESDPANLTTVCGLNALSLRYWFVKLLRIVVWLDRHRGDFAGQLIWHVERQRDEDVAALAACWSAAREVPVEFAWQEPGTPVPLPTAPNAWWRRWAGNWLAAPERDIDAVAPRIVLCGNPRLLEPLCAELVARGCRVSWLYDRFAFRSWWRWRGRGVEQLVLNGSLGSERALPLRRTPGRPLVFEDLDLSPLLEHRLRDLANSVGPRQTRLVDELSRQFARLRPQHVVLDEDATPLARAVVATARAQGASTSVVQNAAPGIRFAFAPLAADRLFAWGNVSRLQLVDWGVPPQRIAVTGSPWHDTLATEILTRRPSRDRGQARLLLLATPPPRASRPDLVAYHKTTRSYQAMIEWCYAAAEMIGARLTVKLHPRAETPEPFRTLADAQPGLEVSLVQHASLADLFNATDVVLSLGSSAGIEATLARLPVVQVMPQGSADLLPAKAWGMVGTARSFDELQVLLCRALRMGRTAPPSREVFGHLAQPAAMQVADLLLAERPVAPRQSNVPPPAGTIKPR